MSDNIENMGFFINIQFYLNSTEYLGWTELISQFVGYLLITDINLKTKVITTKL